MYSLNYDMVIQVLQQFQYSGEARADILPQNKFKGGGYVVLAVQNGTVRSCLLFSNREQRQYHNAEAVSLLSKLGVLEWQLAPFTPTQASSTHVQSSGVGNRTYFYPRRQPVSQVQISTWSALQRFVYSLSDGTHDVKQIALLLSQSPNVIEQVVNDLQKIGALER